MANEVFTQLLREIAFFLELQSENPFKIRALDHSARILEEHEKDLQDLIQSGEIAKIPGVGKGTQALAHEFVKTGALREHAELQAKFPATILEILEVPGLGPKKIKTLYEQLGLGSISELEYACRENRLIELKGFGAKTQANILRGIEQIKAGRGKLILAAAIEEAEKWSEEFLSWDASMRLELAGELRRRMEIISALDFVICATKDITPRLIELGFKGENNFFIKTNDSEMPIHVSLVHPDRFGTVLFEATGPSEFVSSFGSLPPVAEEAQIFSLAQREFFPPECRDLNISEKNLIEESQIKGVFHLHTKWSDGANSLEEMVIAARDLGYEYLGVSEHSRSAFYANGLDEKRVLEQRKEIERLRIRFPDFRIFHGIESDILADGGLDYSAEMLAQFDFVIASVHGQMRMSSKDMTQRLVRALQNPATTWLGHWTGRLLLGRQAYEFDHDEVLKVAANEGKGIELNSSPYRLDMDWRELPRAVAQNISIGIFPDAHSVAGIADVKYGVWMARKAGLRADQIVNTKSAEDMSAWLA